MTGLCAFAFSVCAMLAGAGDEPSTPPWSFEDVAARAGIDWVQRSGEKSQEYIVEVKSTGVALIDFDGDGLLDIFFTAGSTIERYKSGEPGFECRLYRNLGGMRFEDATARAGIPQFNWACGAAAADVNGDGRTDLLVTCIGKDHLLINRDGKFEDLGEKSGLTANGWKSSAAFADLDGDGDLDLYVCGYLEFDFANPPRHGGTRSCLWRDMPVMCGPRGMTPAPDWVYRNRGDGTFEDVSEGWGLRAIPDQYGLAVLVADVVGDATPEIYVVNDAGHNELLARRGAAWVDIGLESGVAYSMDGAEQSGMGVEAADLDGNGHLDLLATNFEQEKNNAFMNQGNGIFFDRAEPLGLGSPSYQWLAWGIGAHDFDGDGALDVFVVNGHVYPQAGSRPGYPGYAQRNHLFHGGTKNGRLFFRERGVELGFGAEKVGRSAAFGDLDNDGDVDIVVGHLNDVPGIYENRPPRANKFLVLTLVQPPPNREAIGARVEVACGETRRVTEVRRNASFQASNDPRIFVGLGENAEAGVARVRWPGGAWESFEIAAGGGAVTLTRGKGKTDAGK